MNDNKEFGTAKELAVFMHNRYEELATFYGWSTQEKTKVNFEELPIENKDLMLHLADDLLSKFSSHTSDKKEEGMEFFTKMNGLKIIISESLVKDTLQKFNNGQISFGKMTEILNERANKCLPVFDEETISNKYQFIPVSEVLKNLPAGNYYCNHDLAHTGKLILQEHYYNGRVWNSSNVVSVLLPVSDNKTEEKELALVDLRERWNKTSDYIKTKNVSVDGIWNFFFPYIASAFLKETKKINEKELYDILSDFDVERLTYAMAIEKIQLLVRTEK